MRKLLSRIMLVGGIIATLMLAWNQDTYPYAWIAGILIMVGALFVKPSEKQEDYTHRVEKEDAIEQNKDEDPNKH